MAESGPKDPTVVPLKRRSCPMCGRPAVVRFRPFCSRRCADLDLGHWLKEDYRVPSDEEFDPEEEPPEGGEEA